MSGGLLENPVIDSKLIDLYTKVVNLILFCLKWYHFLFDSNFIWPCQMAAILDFTHDAMSNLLSGHTTKSDITELIKQW